FFDRLGKKLISFLHETTADGFVYRVDMRLRPFGDSGPLTTSFGALEHYYQIHGRDWERYALIKGRVIGGTPADVEALEAITRPFVYRRYLDFGALDAVREMKAMITAESTKYGLDADLKRGPGGIREIEFIGQTFQLIRGGREPPLRRREIISVLTVCGEQGLLASGEVAGLIDAYRFLRVVEHRLQQVHDRQTQELPSDPDERARIAYGVGFATWESFDAALGAHRETVSRCFAVLLGVPIAESNPTDLLWRHAASLDRTQQILAAAGFADLELAQRALEQIKDPRFLTRLSMEARARLDRLVPALVAECAGRADGARTLRRLVDLVRAIARRSVYIALLADNSGALKR
ncbi:MAG: bifunctional [glutamate--ammonia ligase]-adenylyl-L-tyrosine phosphorylase/[glutamate--ammonia-ligase] adenylyltransferase, partial [Gammaproteobacteria bacterium]